VDNFHKIVATIEAVALRLTTTILLLAALFVFVRHALGV